MVSSRCPHGCAGWRIIPRVNDTSGDTSGNAPILKHGESPAHRDNGGMIERVHGLILGDVRRDLIGKITVLLDQYGSGTAWRGAFRVPNMRHLSAGTYRLRLEDGREGTIITTTIVDGRDVAFQGSGLLAVPEAKA